MTSTAAASGYLRAFALGAVICFYIGAAVARNLPPKPQKPQPERNVVVWTAKISVGFSGNIYTWRLKPDGSYEEDGRDAGTGAPIQPTYAGRWTVHNERMILKQDKFGYVFDGVVIGDHYFGTLYLRDVQVSPFCAVKGETAPAKCEAQSAALLYGDAFDSRAAAIASPSAAMRIGSLATDIPSGASASLTALEIAAGAPR